MKDLFKGYEWNRIPRNDRLLLGTLFLNYVNKTNGKIQAVEKVLSINELGHSKDDIIKLDREIDSLVYKIYNLNDTEIKKVENFFKEKENL